MSEFDDLVEKMQARRCGSLVSSLMLAMDALEALAKERAAARQPADGGIEADRQHIRARIDKMRASGGEIYRLSLNGRQWCGVDGEMCKCAADAPLATCVRRTREPKPVSVEPRHWGMFA